MISTASENSYKFLVHWLIVKMFMDLFLNLCTNLKSDEISKVICQYNGGHMIHVHPALVRL